MKIGIWIKWPGFWMKDGNRDALEFDTEAQAQAYADELGMDMDAIEIVKFDDKD